MRPMQRIVILALAATLAACAPAALVTPIAASPTPTQDASMPTPLPVRTPHAPGEIFEYIAAAG